MLKDQIELLSALNAHGVEYLIVGGHAVNAHGVPRSTKDLDILFRASYPNSERLFRALAQFGTPLGMLTEESFRGRPEQVFQIGVEPSRIDLLQSIDGVDFDQAWSHRVEARVHATLPVSFLGRDDLIRNKQATGRLQDLADVDKLLRVERVRRSSEKPPSGTLS